MCADKCSGGSPCFGEPDDASSLNYLGVVGGSPCLEELSCRQW